MAERLRIAQLAPLEDSVTAWSTGSIEQLVFLLTEELVRRGHEVTLFATGDSRTSALLHAVYPRGYRRDHDLWNWESHEFLHAAAAFERAGDFDVIHSHVYHYALPFTRLVRTPVLHTYHVLPDEDIIRAYERCPEVHVAAISHYQQQVFRGAARAGVVYHGIDAQAFPFRPERGDYLLFLGRLYAEKGVVEALQIARQAGQRLVIAGPVEDDGYFQNQVVPLLDGRRWEYVGPVDRRERNRLLAGALALVYPIHVPEPFGLVLVEAMACGTPVAALGIGAVPEVVDNGVTGYHAPDVESLVELIPAVAALDRARVRQRAVARFDVQRMVDEYENLYRRLTLQERREANEAP